MTRDCTNVARATGTRPRFVAHDPIPRSVEHVASRLAESGCDLNDREGCEHTLAELGFAHNEIDWSQWVRITVIARELRGKQGDPVATIVGGNDAV